MSARKWPKPPYLQIISYQMQKQKFKRCPQQNLPLLQLESLEFRQAVACMSYLIATFAWPWCTLPFTRFDLSSPSWFSFAFTSYFVHSITDYDFERNSHVSKRSQNVKIVGGYQSCIFCHFIPRLFAMYILFVSSSPESSNARTNEWRKRFVFGYLYPICNWFKYLAKQMNATHSTNHMGQTDFRNHIYRLVSLRLSRYCTKISG